MQKEYKLIALYLLLKFNSFSQEYHLPLVLNKAETIKGIKSAIIKTNVNCNRTDSIITLKNGFQLSKYNIYKKTIQKIEPNQYNTIHLLVGYYNGFMIMLVDENRNNLFSDDSVYVMKLSGKYNNMNEFVHNLPLVHLDSIQYVDNLKNVKYFSADFKFSASSTAYGSYFSDSMQMLQSNYYNLSFYKSDYYTTPSFNFKNQEYYLEITPHSVSLNVYPLPNSDFNSTTLILAKKNRHDTIGVAFTQIEYFVKTGEPLPFDKNYFSIQKFDFPNKTISFKIDTFSISNKEIYNVLIKEKYLLLNSKKKVNIPFDKKDFTIIEFGGSWCAPCKQIIPELKKLDIKLKNSQAQLISVAVEYNEAMAYSFQKISKFSWPTFYSELNSESKNSLTQVFKVNIYPTLLVINKKGQVVFKETGSNAVGEVEKFLKAKKNE